MNEGIPMYVLEALAKVRASGKTNMYDRRIVMSLLFVDEDDEEMVDAGFWLEDEGKSRYVEALQKMGELRSEGVLE